MAVRLFLLMMLVAFASQTIGAVSFNDSIGNPVSLYSNGNAVLGPMHLVFDFRDSIAMLYSATEYLRCNHRQFQASKFKAEGYCWYFYNGNYSMSKAITTCGYFDGRLPAINSETKAAKMAIYGRSMRHLYTNGTFMKSWMTYYASGWEGNIVWGDIITNNGHHPMWKTTGLPVSYEAFDEHTPKVQSGESCTTFNIYTGKWRYASCEGKHISFCEESGHDYEDESPDHEDHHHNNDYEEEHTAESCPERFTLVNGRCLALAGGISLGPWKANVFCSHRAGHLAVVTGENDEKALGNFVKAHRVRKMRTFLSNIMYDEDHFVWESTGQNADYVANKLNMRNNPGYLYQNLVALDPDGELMLCLRTSQYCIGRALCQANDQDYYDYAEDESHYYDDNE